MQRVAFTSGATLLLLVGFVGCAAPPDEFPREAVSGTVTLDGQPLKDGNIQFSPVSADAKDATTSGGMIRDGQFRIPTDAGPTPGQYSVLIISGGGADRPAAGEMPGVLPKEVKEKIPAKYNTKTQLTAEVKKGGPNTFEFPLTTK